MEPSNVQHGDAMGLDGKTAIVTGASKGIGRAVAQDLADRGVRLVINARSETALSEAEAEIRAAGGEVVSVAESLLDGGAPGRLVETAVDRFGSVDMIVSNVGINTSYGSMLGASRDKFARAVTDNAWPFIALVQAGLERGLGSGGSVVAVSSIGARQVQPWLGAYAAGKAALESVVRNLARELGPRGVRLNAVAPGLVVTDMSRVLWDNGQTESEAALLPLQRLGTPEDIAGPIVFLLSRQASWITGVTLDVDGGRLLVGQEPRHLYGIYDAQPDFA